MRHGVIAPMSSILEFEGASKRFGAVVALHNVGFTLREGEITALLGRNGAGKTTAIRIALGLLKQDSGRVALWGERPGAPVVRRRVAAMLQQAALPDELTVGELLALFASCHAAPRNPIEVAEALSIGPLLRRRYAALSGGQKRLVQFGVALVGAPDLLVLDEPTTGLDVDARSAFWNSVRALISGGVTILLTTHYLEEADLLADRLLLLHEGALLADGPPAEIKAKVGAKRIRCRTGAALDVLSSMPGVTSVARQGAFTDVWSQAAEATLRALLNADAQIADTTVEGGDLESAVLHLTGPAQFQEAA
jgi:ABC-2 type transport system ATP-binding protein